MALKIFLDSLMRAAWNPGLQQESYTYCAPVDLSE